MEEAEKIVSLFKDANQSLRKRAITIGVLMIITIGLTYTESIRFETVSNLINYQYRLGQIVNLPDSSFHKVIDGDTEKYFPILNPDNNYDYIRLFEKVKFEKYSRSLIEQEIDKADKGIEEVNKEKSIGILGLTIPIDPVKYLSVIIILILFHDFTQVIIYRHQIQRKIRRLKIPDWKLGFELFGFFSESKTSSTRFLKFVSSIVAGGLAICPVITSFLMLDLNTSNSTFLSITNIVCFSLIIIDTIIILNTENVWNFRYYFNYYLGNYNFSKSKMRRLWLFSMLTITVFYLSLATEIPASSHWFGVFYFVIGVLPFIPLYIFLNRTFMNPNKINRAIRAGLLVVNIFWIYAMVHNAFTFDKWDFYKVQIVSSMLFISFIVSTGISFIYIRYFIIDSNRKGN